jgi:hypothetical protein
LEAAASSHEEKENQMQKEGMGADEMLPRGSVAST